MTEVAPRRRGDEQNRQRRTLLATSISYGLVILDTSIVNVALENISRDLGSGDYSLTTGNLGLMLSASDSSSCAAIEFRVRLAED
jgi:hypothetical protein